MLALFVQYFFGGNPLQFLPPGRGRLFLLPGVRALHLSIHHGNEYHVEYAADLAAELQDVCESLADNGAVTGGAASTELMVIAGAVPDAGFTLIVATTPETTVAMPVIGTGTAPPFGTVNANPPSGAGEMRVETSMARRMPST